MKFALAIALFACGMTAHAETVVPTRDDSTFSLEIRFMSRSAALEACKNLGAWSGSQPRGNATVGCNLFYPDSHRCVVIVPEPTEVDDIATTVLGHEVLHCARGRYHAEGRS